MKKFNFILDSKPRKEHLKTDGSFYKKDKISCPYLGFNYRERCKVIAL